MNWLRVKLACVVSRPLTCQSRESSPATSPVSLTFIRVEGGWRGGLHTHLALVGGGGSLALALAPARFADDRALSSTSLRNPPWWWTSQPAQPRDPAASAHAQPLSPHPHSLPCAVLACTPQITLGFKGWQGWVCVSRWCARRRASPELTPLNLHWGAASDQPGAAGGEQSPLRLTTGHPGGCCGVELERT
jgi:hypothetical protein